MRSVDLKEISTNYEKGYTLSSEIKFICDSSVKVKFRVNFKVSALSSIAKKMPKLSVVITDQSLKRKSRNRLVSFCTNMQHTRMTIADGGKVL